MTNKENQLVLEWYIIENKDRLYRIAYSYVKNKEEALDIVQESIYKALQSIKRNGDIKYIKTWFYRILVRTAIDFLRKHKKIDYVEDFVSDLEMTEDNYGDLDLQTALDCLPIQYKTIIILKYFEDLTFEEIADTLELNVNTVKTRLYAGLKKLRIELESER